MTSGLIQYGVPVTDFIPVPDRQMVCSRRLAPKSPSFTFPAESLRMLAPNMKKSKHENHFGKERKLLISTELIHNILKASHIGHARATEV